MPSQLFFRNLEIQGLKERKGKGKKEEKMMETRGRIFCDMDGVLTDFDGRFEYFTGLTPKEYEDTKGTEAFWNAITPIGKDFWSKMPWTPGGRRLWNFIKNYEPRLLTAPSQDVSSRIGKKEWVINNLTPIPKVIFKGAKYKHQAVKYPTDILIDDRYDNIARWRSAGGIGLHHPTNGDPSEVIEKLKELGF